VDEVAAQMHRRVKIEIRETGDGAWTLRETAPPYGKGTPNG
jgi:hypothetical protein